VTDAARAFVALALGAELGARIGEQVERALAGGSWRLPASAGLHLTLAFLGDVERVRLEKLAESLAPALAELDAPELRLGGTGAFPSARRARVLWIGLEERGSSGRLASCRRAVLDGLAATGIPHAERDEFRPHVTVARPRRNPGPLPEAFGALCFDEPWEPREVTLFESRTGPQGSQYVPLASFPLRASP